MQIQICTFNANTNRVKDLDIENWFSSTEPSPDILAAGFQELISQAQAIYTPPTQQCTWVEGEREGDSIEGLDAWIELLFTALTKIHGVQYRLLWAGRRSALGLLVIVKEKMLIESIHSGSIGSGLFGVYGNKGSIGCSITCAFSGSPELSSYTFINSHLGPHEGSSYCTWRKEEAGIIAL